MTNVAYTDYLWEIVTCHFTQKLIAVLFYLPQYKLQFKYAVLRQKYLVFLKYSYS